jgi:hypothetical protein
LQSAALNVLTSPKPISLSNLQIIHKYKLFCTDWQNTLFHLQNSS